MAFNFSTEGVSGSCMKMILSAALGNLSAATIVAPSTGTSPTRSTEAPSPGSTPCPSARSFTGGPQWYVPGLYEVDFDLPSACFGQKDVTIRLQAASRCAAAPRARTTARRRRPTSISASATFRQIFQPRKNAIMKYAKRYMAKIGSAGILLAALAATACMDHGDDIPLIELGAVENSFTVNATAGHVDIQVYSNQPAVLSLLDDGACGPT
ncbi:MAG: hypothetical protein ACLRMJ_03670 [Alistipes finegoldii]